mgnify:CR=1 FL=1
MKKTIHEDAPANAMGGGFVTGQVGDPGNIAGMSAPLGCPAPITTRSGECFNKRQILNRNQQDKISKIIQILMGRTFPTKELNEKLEAVSFSKAPENTAKGIAGLRGAADGINPPQIAPLSKTKPKIVSGVNGLSTPPATIGRVVSDLQAAKNRFSRLNVDPARAATDPVLLYKTKNIVRQAEDRNATLDNEMQVFFKKPEDDSTTDELVTRAVSDHFSNKRIT